MTNTERNTKNQFKDYFSGNSNDYANYRPHYPEFLVNVLSSLAPDQNLVLDCGCGTGQLSVHLAGTFKNVIAIDASENQILNAEPRQNIVYHVKPAEKTGLDNHSVDLITVAQAAHWLDLDSFYQEVQRIAKPKAILALITYGVLFLKEESLNQVVQEFYYRTIYEFWPKERKDVEDGYINWNFPFDEIDFPKTNMNAVWNLFELLGYIKTWSAVKIAEKKLGYNPVDQLFDQLLPIWDEPYTTREIFWPLRGRLGRVIEHPQ